MSFVPHKGHGINEAGGGGGIAPLWSTGHSSPNYVFSNGGLTATAQLGNVMAFLNSYYESGKIYLEIDQGVAENNQHMGTCLFSYGTEQDMENAGAWSIRTGNRLFCNGVSQDRNGDSGGGILMIAIDMDAKKFWAGVNGVWVENLSQSPGNPGDPAAGLFPACDPVGAQGLGAVGSNGAGNEYTIRTVPFYTIPAGFVYWGEGNPIPIADGPPTLDVFFDPTRAGSGVALVNTDLTAQFSSSNQSVGCLAVTDKSAGKWYAEIIPTSWNTKDTLVFSGLVDPTGRNWNTQSGGTTGAWGRLQDGTIQCNGVNTGATTTWNANDIIQYAVDLDAGKFWVGKNGVFDGDPGAGTGEACTGVTGPLTIACDRQASGNSIEWTLTNGFSTFARPAGFDLWAP